MLKNNPEINFPFTYDETGKCEKLGPDNQCQVYESRPDLCNIDKMIDKLGLDKSQMYLETIKICNNFIHEDGLDPKYLLKINP